MVRPTDRRRRASDGCAPSAPRHPVRVSAAREPQLAPRERRLGFGQLADQGRQGRAEPVEHLSVVDDRMLRSIGRLPGFCGVALAQRAPGKTGIRARPLPADLLVELGQPLAQVVDEEDQLHRAATEQGMRFPIVVMQRSRLQ
jgi:hypothetical protein